jgi:hypothetical protein
MDARDFGNTVTLYLPQGAGGGPPYAVFQDRSKAGDFPTRDEALRFATALAATIRTSRSVNVRMRIEDEAGGWETRDSVAAG